MLKADNNYFNKNIKPSFRADRRRISRKPEPSFRAVGEESHTRHKASLVRDISLTLNMTDNLHVIPYYDTESVSLMS